MGDSVTTADLVLGTEVPALTVVLQHGGVASFALDVTDAAGAPADLTGLTATIETTAGERWTATVVDSKFTWSISSEASSALSYSSCNAVLAVTDEAATRVIWARGKVEVRR